LSNSKIASAISFLSLRKRYFVLGRLTPFRFNSPPYYSLQLLLFLSVSTISKIVLSSNKILGLTSFGFYISWNFWAVQECLLHCKRIKSPSFTTTPSFITPTRVLDLVNRQVFVVYPYSSLRSLMILSFLYIFI
jgi:hypothetical protein